MSNDITFILRAKNEARNAAKSFKDDMLGAGAGAKKVGEEAEKARKETDKLGDSAKDTRDDFNMMAKAAGGFGSAIAQALSGLAIGATLMQAASDAREFSAALAEVSTVVPGLPGELESLANAARDLAGAYGGTGAAQLGGFYQAISAGVSDVALATKLVDDANKLAIGGVTDVTTAVDILTTVVNSYGASAISTAEASDALFIGALGGKTTIEELAHELGTVIPIAKAAGVSFDELVAVISALTTQGIQTNAAATQIKALLTGVIRGGSQETSRFAQSAREMGIEFNLAGLQAKGLSGFLADLVDKTGGSADQIGKLFESVEATTAVLALSGEGGAKFADILDQMREKAGVTDEAFKKISENLDQRFKVAVAGLGIALERSGRSSSPFWCPPWRRCPPRSRWWSTIWTTCW